MAVGILHYANRHALGSSGKHWLCLPVYYFSYRLWYSQFPLCSLSTVYGMATVKALTRFWLLHLRNIHDQAFAFAFGPPNTGTDVSSVFPTLMRMELHSLAVIVDVYFPPLSLKIRFVRPSGLPIVLSASPLCMSAPCRRCSTKQPHWNAANTISIVA